MPKVLIECTTVHTQHYRGWVDVSDEWLDEQLAEHLDMDECVEEGMEERTFDFQRDWHIVQIEGDEYELIGGSWFKNDEGE